MAGDAFAVMREGMKGKIGIGKLALCGREYLVAVRPQERGIVMYTLHHAAEIHHAATIIEAQLCGGEDIVIVGGGNSAGQAALFLSRTVAQVHLLIRQGNLSSTMSSYLVERLLASPKVFLRRHRRVSSPSEM